MMCVRYAVVIAWVGVRILDVRLNICVGTVTTSHKRTKFRHCSGSTWKQQLLHLPNKEKVQKATRRTLFQRRKERQLSCFRCINPILKYTPIRTLSLLKRPAVLYRSVRWTGRRRVRIRRFAPGLSIYTVGKDKGSGR